MNTNQQTPVASRPGTGKMRFFRKVALASSLLFFGAFSAQSQNLIQNASFEKPSTAGTVPASGWYLEIYSSGAAIPNWTVATSNYISWHHKNHWSMSVPPGSKKTTDETGMSQQERFEFSVVPNPASTSASVSMNADKETEAQLVITDITGRVLLNKTQTVNAGANKIEFDTRNFAEGLYNVQVIMNGIKSTERLVIKQ